MNPAYKNLNELAESFELFDNWEDRYRYLIELGERLPLMDDSLKTDDNKVRGCTSQVWIHTYIEESDSGDEYFMFLADSDAQIVKGLIYLLMIAYNGKPVSMIEKVDINESFEKLGLSHHLSPNRRNGFFAMVEKIHLLSKSHLN